jgi:hypothetical protein
MVGSRGHDASTDLNRVYVISSNAIPDLSITTDMGSGLETDEVNHEPVG